MKSTKILLALALLMGITGVSCDKEILDAEESEWGGNLGLTTYVITATPVGTTGIADYLLTTDDLTQGTISTAGNGIEQDGSYRYYVNLQGRFFSLLYGQGNPGAVTTYRLNTSGKLVKTSDFQTETVQAFTPVNGTDILLMKIPRSGNQSASLFRVDAEKSMIAGEAQINIVELAANGERAHFTWATQVGDKVFAPYMSIKGVAPDAFGTLYPDSSWIAVLKYPELTVEKVIRDNRTSFIGAYFNNGVSVDENGDAYCFSYASATNSGTPNSTKPSAIVRVKSGTTEFDQSYFFNVQEKSGGYHMSAQTYVGNGKFLIQTYGNPNALTGSKKLALVDVYEQTFVWISGAPENIKSMSAPYNNNTAFEEKSKIFIGLNTDNGNSIYYIDMKTATAVQGLKVEGGTITSIVKMDY